MNRSMLEQKHFRILRFYSLQIQKTSHEKSHRFNLTEAKIQNKLKWLLALGHRPLIY